MCTHIAPNVTYTPAMPLDQRVRRSASGRELVGNPVQHFRAKKKRRGRRSRAPLETAIPLRYIYALRLERVLSQPRLLLAREEPWNLHCIQGPWPNLQSKWRRPDAKRYTIRRKMKTIHLQHIPPSNCPRPSPRFRRALYRTFLLAFCGFWEGGKKIIVREASSAVTHPVCFQWVIHV